MKIMNSKFWNQIETTVSSRISEISKEETELRESINLLSAQIDLLNSERAQLDKLVSLFNPSDSPKSYTIRDNRSTNKGSKPSNRKSNSPKISVKNKAKGKNYPNSSYALDTKSKIRDYVSSNTKTTLKDIMNNVKKPNGEKYSLHSIRTYLYSLGITGIR